MSIKMLPPSAGGINEEICIMKSSDLPVAVMIPGPGKHPGSIESFLVGHLASRLDRCQGQLTLQFPSGFRKRFGTGSPEVDVRLHSLRPLLRLFLGGANGWSDSYLHGEWHSSDLTALVRWALLNQQYLSTVASARWCNNLMYNIYHWCHPNSRRGSRRNIAAHYDLGNSFYAHWLDPGMTYSSALFDSDGTSLEDAQALKYSRIMELLAPQSGDHILEIGCGWGEFARQLLNSHDVRVHGVTLSKEQLQWASDKLRTAGLAQRGEISLTDYRDIRQQYDGVVSIEMFEAVGQAHWDTFFTQLKGMLKPGGRAVLQIITIDDDRFAGYSRQADFIQRHVFPGGMLPSVAILREKCSRHGFRLAHQQMFGKDYARTLACWRDAFENTWPEITKLGFDERFYRLWRYYLSYCEGGFEEGAIDVGLFVLEHNGA
ncbi:MAG: class I SAM-dependent methyltransferase [Gammaproteobacteria bacterium]|nr:MAG: class I SAM-dependent methyltransferase [Gammaproteobacteria bacterium]